jgi:O-antigen/teichoic acid export membrane protein
MVWKFLKKTQVKKNLAISIVGTGIAQLIHLCATPILSRIYTPETFGHYALFLSLLGIFTSITLMKFDLAIMVCKKDEVQSLKETIFKISLSIIPIIFLTGISFTFLEINYSKLLFFLTFGLIASNKFWTHRAITNKAAHFKRLGLGKILENSSNAVTAILLGILSIKDYGLIIGKIFSIFITWLFYQNKSKELYLEKSPLSNEEIVKKYNNYPKFSFPAELLAHINLNASVFLFTYFFSSLEVGLIGLTTRVLSIPTNFISLSFFDVFKQKAVIDFKQSGEFKGTFFKFLWPLMLIAICMILLLFFTGPELFQSVFGDNWYSAGIYAQYLCIFYGIRLIAMPLVFSLEIVNKHSINLIFQFLYLTAGILSIVITKQYTNDDTNCIIAYSLTLGLLNIINIYYAYLNCGGKKKYERLKL